MGRILSECSAFLAFADLYHPFDVPTHSLHAQFALSCRFHCSQNGSDALILRHATINLSCAASPLTPHIPVSRNLQVDTSSFASPIEPHILFLHQAIPAALGVSLRLGLQMNSLTVPRSPGEVRRRHARVLAMHAREGARMHRFSICMHAYLLRAHP
eukprot:4363728-Pleurochrysis_carterae.AAC.3